MKPPLIKSCNNDPKAGQIVDQFIGVTIGTCFAVFCDLQLKNNYNYQLVIAY
jgi:hypothetical protein